MKKLSATLITMSCLLINGSLWADTAITSLPYEINIPGNYYIESDLSSAGFGIIIRASDVTIDLRGNSLEGSGVDTGIYAWQPRNVEVKNGTVRQFRAGITSALTALNSFKVTDVRVVNNVSAGISLASANNIIKDCIAANNGGTGIGAGKNSVVTGNSAYKNGLHGIFVGAGSTVSNNTAHDNVQHGVYADKGSVVNQNAGYSNGNSGVFCVDACVIKNNTGYGNGNHGVGTNGNSTIKNNTAYGNQANGILVYAQSLIDGNTAYSNDQSGKGFENIKSCATCTFGLNHAP